MHINVTKPANSTGIMIQLRVSLNIRKASAEFSSQEFEYQSFI